MRTRGVRLWVGLSHSSPSTDCWDELGNLRRHGQCWNITYLDQTTCMGACCHDGETSIAPPTCGPVPACRPGQQPYSSALQCCKQCSVTGGGERALALDLLTAALPLGVFSYPPAPHPSPRPSVNVKVQVPLKECEGKRPYRIYMAEPEKMDAFAYSIVNRDQVHVLQWNVTGIHSLKMSRATFAALPQRPFYLYMGRSTSGLRHRTLHPADCPLTVVHLRNVSEDMTLRCRVVVCVSVHCRDSL